MKNDKVTAGLMWHPDTWPIVYAIASSARPNASAMPRVPIVSTARIAVPGPTIMRTNVPTISAAKILRFDGPAAATVSVGMATGVVGAGSYAAADCGWAGSPGGGGDDGGGGGGTLDTHSSSGGTGWA